MYDSEFTYYNPDEIGNVLDTVVHKATDKIIYRKKQYFNIPCAFDIETTSTYLNGHKVAFMYIWTLNINGTTIIGRTWEQFEQCIETIHQKLFTNPERIFVIYVHNLNFEFSFLGRRFVWEKVFSIDSRKPIYARTVDGIEFRCSYLLSGYNLAKVGENLQKYKVQKMVGDLDYYKVRHSGSYITPKEMRYVINDGRVVVAYIQEEIERNGNIAKIPLTKTGYVRQACRRNCFSKSHRTRSGSRYRNRIKRLTLTLEEYDLLKDAFAGGFTHANPWYTRKILHNVKSFDFTSSYPAVMVCEKFPMSKGEKIENIDTATFKESIKNYCCVFTAKITGLESRVMFDNPISSSKCKVLKGDTLNNGRVVSAKELYISMTNVDYEVYKKFYKWKTFSVSTFYRYKAGYLPKEFVDSILTFYEDKTKLKGVKGKEAEYLHQKENVNSCYGMAVTDILRDMVIFDPLNPQKNPRTGELEAWYNHAINRQEEIEKYNKNPLRFLFYTWGIFVTSYARKNLFSGILAVGTDYIYADTDSLKILNYEKHKSYFDNYNRQISKRLEIACKYHGFDVSRVRPKTIKGVEKPLGVWDDETSKPDKLTGVCAYPCFITLGAKRYMYLENGELHVTLAGSNKEKTAKYLEKTYGKYYAFYKFDNNLVIPPAYSGRTSSCYIDFPTSGEVTDYRGVKGSFSELSSVHVEQTDYSLSITRSYINYFLHIQEDDPHV